MPLFVERLEDRTVPSFFPPSYYAAGEIAFSVAVADFNRDSVLDFVVSNRGEFPGDLGNSIDVFLGNGDGTFQNGIRTAVGENPTSVVVHDFDGDEVPDVATTSYLGANINVLMGIGDGTFRAPTVYPVGILPRNLVVADLDGNGKADLAVGNLGATTVSILRGTNDGTFQAAQTFEVYPGASPNWLALGDFNFDLIPDLVVVDDFGNSVSVLLNNGDATFGAPYTFEVQRVPRGGAVDDLNLDGWPDLVVVNQINSTATVLMGNGVVSFTPAIHYPTGNGPQHVITVDLNQDGWPDIVTANIFSNVFSVLLNNGDGTFGRVTNYPIHDYGAGAAAADFNGDYYPDLVIALADDPGGEAVVLLNAADWSGGSPGGAGSAPGGRDPLGQAVLALTQTGLSTGRLGQRPDQVPGQVGQDPWTFVPERRRNSPGSAEAVAQNESEANGVIRFHPRARGEALFDAQEFWLDRPLFV